MSNIISILNEDLSFSIADFLKLKEIQKLYATKELLIPVTNVFYKLKALESLHFLKVEDDKVKYILSDTLAYFNFLNIPGKLPKDEIAKALNLNEHTDKYSRFYKKYLYWLLVSEDREFCEKFEKTLKGIKFVEDANLRYEYLPQSLKETLIKKVQRNIYSREASELKATTPISEKQNGNQSLGNHGNSNDSLGWRKKSSDLTATKVESNNNKNNNTYNNNDLYKASSFNDVPVKRERFNSDGDNNKSYQSYKQNNYSQNSYESIFQNNFRLDYSKIVVKYSTESNI